MSTEIGRRFEELSHQYPSTAAAVLENTQDAGFEPHSAEETAEALRQLVGRVDAGEAE
jgi:hypothetical protein